MNVKQVSNGKEDHVDSGANVDAVQIAIGNLGKWQIVVCLAISLVKFPVAWHQLAIVFMAPHQDYNCTKPATDSQDQCTVDLNGTLAKCTEWEYDREIFPETIISQVSLKAFSLYCAKRRACLFKNYLARYERRKGTLYCVVSVESSLR